MDGLVNGKFCSSKRICRQHRHVHLIDPNNDTLGELGYSQEEHKQAQVRIAKSEREPNCEQEVLGRFRLHGDACVQLCHVAREYERKRLDERCQVEQGQVIGIEIPRPSQIG
ncbi:hypothetical protein KY289_008042 [Solanum tuberosum]|nr:hypothetical protein KY289_008042 [Solanum tuberosum]